MNRFALKDLRATDAGGTGVDLAGVSEDRVRQSVLRILAGSILCSMATVTQDAGAHINTANFSYSSELRLYFLSHPDALHCRNLMNNPSMAVTVFSAMLQWNDPGQGVQLFGTCEQVSGADAKEAERSYGRRFPGYQNWKAALEAGAPGSQYRFYRFAVTEVKVLDEKNLGDAVFVHARVAPAKTMPGLPGDYA